MAALALASGPLAGMLIGFWAGLALDVAPPGSHFIGQDALVFCLIGYACGRLRGPPATRAGRATRCSDRGAAAAAVAARPCTRCSA